MGPLADLFCWSYIRTCEHYETTLQVVGFDEIAVLYRPQRRALLNEIIHSKIPRSRARAYADAHLAVDIDRQHHAKFIDDVIVESQNMDVSRIAGLGVTRQELNEWLELR